MSPHLARDAERSRRPMSWRALRARVMAVMLSLSLALMPAHHLLAGVAAPADDISSALQAAAMHQAGDHPCAPDHGADTGVPGSACCGGASGCTVAAADATSPAAPSGHGSSVGRPGATAFAGWDDSPTPPPPRLRVA